MVPKLGALEAASWETLVLHPCQNCSASQLSAWPWVPWADILVQPRPILVPREAPDALGWGCSWLPPQLPGSWWWDGPSWWGSALPTLLWAWLPYLSEAPCLLTNTFFPKIQYVGANAFRKDKKADSSPLAATFFSCQAGWAAVLMVKKPQISVNENEKLTWAKVKFGSCTLWSSAETGALTLEGA